MGLGESLSTSTSVFSGIFDGKGKFISLNNNDTRYSSSGCFGAVRGGTIQNLTVKGVTSNGYATGGVVGWIDGGTVYNCKNECTVSGTGAGIGGVCGLAVNSHINMCYNIKSVRGNTQVGGIVGSLSDNSRITSCYNTGDVTATGVNSRGWSYVGGLIGHIYLGRTCRVENSYSNANVSGIVGVGGFFGTNRHDTPVMYFTNCYCTGTVSANSGVASFAGAMTNVSFNNCFTSINVWSPSVETNISYGNSKTISESELKGYASTLGSAFKLDTGNINKGFPILSWQ